MSTAPQRATAWFASGLLLLAGGCSFSTGSDSAGPAGSVFTDGDNVLRITAGSEVKDLVPILTSARDEIGVEVQLQYTGTISGAESLAAAAKPSYDATWFSSNRYLSLVDQANSKIATSESIMLSPVVLGLAEDKVKELGWNDSPPSWADISAAASAGKFSYGMTNPTSSNSGFSSLVAVATALAGNGVALTEDKVNTAAPELKGFFSGQKMTSGSSGWLAAKFAAQASRAAEAGPRVDGLFNYESVLLGLKDTTQSTNPLTMVYPKDGVVTADYPLSLLKTTQPEKRALYEKLTTWLKSKPIQERIMKETGRRAVAPGVKPDDRFSSQVLVEVPFPGQRKVVDGLLSTYLNKIQKPSRTIYVIDTSGSMKGDRLASLKASLNTLTGVDAKGSQRFATFRERENVTLLTFNSTVQEPRTFEVPADDPAAVLGQIRQSASGLEARGGTAMYDALYAAYGLLGAHVGSVDQEFQSIVLMTDGKRSKGMNAGDFRNRFAQLPAGQRAIPTFAVIFGDSPEGEMKEIAQATGGKVFDARKSSLSDVFREIRGYQ